MGRPPEHGKRTSTGVRFDPDLLERLHVAARDRDVSVNWLVNRAVTELLDHLIPADEMVWTRPAAKPEHADG